MKACCVTDKGSVRTLNEDYYYLPQYGENFAAVADGMGGHAAGEVASRMAANTLAANLRKHTEDMNEQTLRDAFAAANESVCAAASADNAKKGMGTTLTALVFCGRTAYVAHVGDSRAYLYRGGKLRQVTTDHSYVEELVANGIITRAQAATHPKRNLITRCVGMPQGFETDVYKLDNKNNDIWLLCSDGLVKYVTDEEISAVLSGRDSLGQKINTLKDMALTRGGSDNITVMAVNGGSD